MKAFGFVAVAVTMGISQPVHAAVTVRLAGHVYYQTADTRSDFALGQVATAWFTFDENAQGETFSPGGVLDPALRFYRSAPTSGGMNIGDYTVQFSSAARMFVTNNESTSNGPIDRVLFDDFGAIGDTIAGRALDVVSISFEDRSAKILNNLQLQSAATALPEFTDIRASLDWNPYVNAQHRISIAFNSLEVTGISAVPEPATWAMMLIGFGFIGWSLRRVKQVATVNFA